MNTAFYIAAVIAVASTIMVITRYNIMHALLYLIVSFMAIAVIFFIYGAPYMAVLELIIYAGAIMVLIIFFVMMLNLGAETAVQEKSWMTPRIWFGPAVLSGILLAELWYLFYTQPAIPFEVKMVSPKAVGISLFTTYLITAELAAMLLMAGIVGAYHLGRQKKKIQHRFLEQTEE